MKLVSIVISVYNEEKNLLELYKQLREVLKSSKKIDYELIFVNDGSKDNSKAVLLKLIKDDHRIKLVDLARNFGHEIAMTAGMDHASGDAVIFMDADLQHPPTLVPKMIEKWQDGHEVVLTRIIDNADKGWIRNCVTSLFYKVINILSDVKIHPNTPDFRLVSKEYIAILKNMREDKRLFRGMLYWLGVSEYAVLEFSAPKRMHGKSNYNLSKSLSLAVDAIMQFSLKPLRISIILSAISGFLSVLFGLWTVYEHFIDNKPASGYTTIVCLITFLFSLQFLIMGIIGEYIGRIHIESKNRPLYFARVIDSESLNENKN